MSDIATIQSALEAKMLASDPETSTSSTETPVTVTDLNPNPNPNPTNDSTSTPPTPVVDSVDESGDDFEFSWEKEGAGDENKGVEEGRTVTPVIDPAQKTAPVVKDGTGVADPATTEKEIDWDTLPPKQVEDAFLRTPRGKAMLTRFKEMRELSKPVAEGGLGFIPSVEDTRNYFQASEVLDAMDYDFSSGDPVAAQKFISNWWSLDKEGNPTRGGLVAAEQLAESLPEPYYMTVAGKIITNYINELVTRSEKAGDDKEKQYIKVLAKALSDDLGITSRIKGLANDAANLDPALAEARRKLDQEKEEINQSRLRNSEAREKAVIGQINGVRIKNFQSDLFEVMNSSLSNLPDDKKSEIKSSLIYTSLVDNFKKEVQNGLVKDLSGKERFNRLLNIAKSTGSEADRNAVIQQFRKMTAPLIRSLAPKYRSALVNQIKNVSDSTHASLDQGSKKVAPASPGQPTRETIYAKPERLKDESQTEYMQRVLSSKMSIA